MESSSLPSRSELRRLLKAYPHLTERQLLKKLHLPAALVPAFQALYASVIDESTPPSFRGKKYKEPSFSRDRSRKEILEIHHRGEDGLFYGRLLSSPSSPFLPLLPMAWEDERTLSQLHLRDHVAVKIGKRRGQPVALFIRRVSRVTDLQVGSFIETASGGLIIPANRRLKGEWSVGKSAIKGLKTGDLVLVRLATPQERDQKKFKRKDFRRSPEEEVEVLERLGREEDTSLISLIALYTHDIPRTFPPAVLTEAAQGQVPSLEGRVDLRSLPLVTIDGPDARDFDDAVYAEPDSDAGNPEGWKLLVAIADVAHYVRPFSLLDQEAQKRGNSVYFPDRVVPMLPESLSNGLCSLQPHVDRACVAVEMTINQRGHLIHYRFMRGLMKSAARLTYEEVQGIHDTHQTHHPLWKPLSHLFGAYNRLAEARQGRGALELELPEYKALLDDKGQIKDVYTRSRLASHQLIEEFMICANVAAAQFLEKKRIPCVYRIHDEPDPAKIVALDSFMGALPTGERFPALPSQVQAHHLNQVLKVAGQSPLKPLLSEMILRSQSQARYSPENVGHFGLHLTHYAHFTSPIRRYADLLVHRGLIAALTGQEDEFPYLKKELQEISDHISMTERRAVSAERDTMERYLCHFLQDRIGATFDAYISTVTKFALFVTLLENGASGIIPIENLGPRGAVRYHDRSQTLKAGRKTYAMGQFLQVSLESVHITTGRIHLRPVV